MKRKYQKKRNNRARARKQIKRPAEKKKYYQRGYRARTRKSNVGKTVLLVLGCVALIAMFALAILGLASGKDTTSTYVKQNTKDIGILKIDVAETRDDLAELSGKFDNFMFKSLEIMLAMKQSIDQATRDESVHVTLTNVGVAETTSSSSSDTNQDVTVSGNEGKDMPHSG